MDHLHRHSSGNSFNPETRGPDVAGLVCVVVSVIALTQQQQQPYLLYLPPTYLIPPFSLLDQLRGRDY